MSNMVLGLSLRVSWLCLLLFSSGACFPASKAPWGPSSGQASSSTGNQSPSSLAAPSVAAGSSATYEPNRFIVAYDSISKAPEVPSQSAGYVGPQPPAGTGKATPSFNVQPQTVASASGNSNVGSVHKASPSLPPSSFAYTAATVDHDIPFPYSNTPSLSFGDGPVPYGGTPGLGEVALPYSHTPSSRFGAGPVPYGGTPGLGEVALPYSHTPSSRFGAGPVPYGGTPGLGEVALPYSHTPSSRFGDGPVPYGGTPGLGEVALPYSHTPSSRFGAGPIPYGGTPGLGEVALPYSHTPSLSFGDGPVPYGNPSSVGFLPWAEQPAGGAHGYYDPSNWMPQSMSETSPLPPSTYIIQTKNGYERARDLFSYNQYSPETSASAVSAQSRPAPMTVARGGQKV